jgi:hypothetical protein
MYDAYRHALINSIYASDVEEQDRRRRQSLASKGAREILTKALTPIAPTTSFGQAASLGSGLQTGSTMVGAGTTSAATPALLSSGEIGAATAPMIAAPALGAGVGGTTGATLGTAAVTAPSLMTAGEIGAVGTAATGTGAGVGEAGAATAGVAGGLGAGLSAGIGLPVALGLAMLSSQPGDFLFGGKKAMHETNSWAYDHALGRNSLVGQVVPENITKWVNPQTYTDMLFGDPNDQEAQAKERARKVGLSSALGAMTGQAERVKRGQSGGVTPLDPDE